MGLFRKSKPASQSPARRMSDEQQAVADAFALQVETAAQMEDPAKRLLELQKIDRKIEMLIEEKKAGISPDAMRDEWVASFAKMGGGGTVGAVGIAIALHVPVIAVLALPVIAAAIPYAGMKVEEAVKKAQAEIAPYFDALEATQKKAAAMIAKTIHQDIAGVMKSSSFGAALESVPGLSERFAEVYQKQQKDPEQKPPAPQKPANDAAEPERKSPEKKKGGDGFTL